jgi:hypothetical protein
MCQNQSTSWLRGVTMWLLRSLNSPGPDFPALIHSLVSVRIDPQISKSAADVV